MEAWWEKEKQEKDKQTKKKQFQFGQLSSSLSPKCPPVSYELVVRQSAIKIDETDQMEYTDKID